MIEVIIQKINQLIEHIFDRLSENNVFRLIDLKKKEKKKGR